MFMKKVLENIALPEISQMTKNRIESDLIEIARIVRAAVKAISDEELALMAADIGRVISTIGTIAMTDQMLGVDVDVTLEKVKNSNAVPEFWKHLISVILRTLDESDGS